MKSVLLIRYSALGDVVLATSLLEPLRAKYPGARIEWLTEETFAPLLAGTVDRVISFSRRNPVSRAAAMLDVRARFDLAIDLQNKLWSLRIARAAAPVRRRFVRRTTWQALKSLVGRDTVLDSTPTTRLYADTAELEHVGPLRLSPDAAATNRAATLLASGTQPWIAIAPGAAWATKRWPAARFAELATLLKARGFRIALAGGPMDAPLLADARASGAIDADLTNEPLPVLAAALARCALLIGNDSGLVHVAQAVGSRALAIFGPTSVKRWGPAQPSAALSLGLGCSPCSNHGSASCPLGHHDCLQKLDVGRVLDAASGVLTASPNQRP